MSRRLDSRFYEQLRSSDRPAGYARPRLAAAVAAKLNGRPRETLGFMTPAEKFAEAVATTH